MSKKTLISIVSPAYNESKNLPILYEALRKTFLKMNFDWEWVVVDDHSSDGTFTVLSALAQRDPRVRAFRLSRNFGSHAAVSCGMRNARGGLAVVLASDLQDSPDIIPQMVEKWCEGAQVVWAVRGERTGISPYQLMLSRLYYFLMRQFVGLKEVPATGADSFLIDRVVMDALNQFDETNVSLLILISWMGFRQEYIVADKKARMYGRSGWSLEKKIKLLLDSVTAFSYRPIRIMSYLGIAISFLGFMFAVYIVANAFLGQPPQGWSSLMVAVLFVGGCTMLMMGILGEYIWRSLDESRRRPRFLIESSIDRTVQTRKEGRPSLMPSALHRAL